MAMKNFCQELGCFIPIDQTAVGHTFCREHSNCNFTGDVRFSTCNICSNLVSDIVHPSTPSTIKQVSKMALISWISGFDCKIASASKIIEFMLEIPFEDIVESSPEDSEDDLRFNFEDRDRDDVVESKKNKQKENTTNQNSIKVS